jgi:hypothetical protein
MGDSQDKQERPDQPEEKALEAAQDEAQVMKNV